MRENCRSIILYTYSYTAYCLENKSWTIQYLNNIRFVFKSLKHNVLCYATVIINGLTTRYFISTETRKNRIVCDPLEREVLRIRHYTRSRLHSKRLAHFIFL